VNRSRVGGEYPPTVVTLPDVPAVSDAPTSGAPSAPSEATAVPPVVAVVVAHDPGAWFEETLASLAAQTYGNLSVLVVDTGTGIDLRSRIAPILPQAHHRHVDGVEGFGAAADEVLRAVQGAAFLLLCHDDVRLDPEVVQELVEEAFRSNAGVVGPKLVEWGEPDRLLSVGMGADRTGYPAPYVERGELDQEQHDAVRDVFYVPGAVTLIRADLFTTLGGFDPGIDFHGEDLDLCWRAHVAGARVVVAPAARVAHLEALGQRRPVDDRRRRQMRHRLRAMRVSTTWWTRLRLIPQAMGLTLLELVYCVVLGRFRQARDVVGAWLWNSRHRGEIRRRRRALAKVRTVGDRDVRALQAQGSARLAAFLRGQIGSRDDRLPTVAGASRDLAATMRSSKARTAMLAWVAVLVVFAVGSRDLIFGRLPAVGELLLFGESSFDLVQAWVSGFRPVGAGAVAPNPTALGLFGGLGTVLLGSLDLLRKLLVLGMLPLGAAGMWRLCKPIGSRRARVVALLVYAAVPVPYNALATGAWSALVLYAAAPWMVGQLVRASRLAPFGDVGGVAGPGVRRRPLVQRVLVLAAMTALAAMITPLAILVVPALAVLLVVGGLVAGQVAGALRMLVTGVGAAVGALVLQLPWSLSFVADDWAAVLGAVSDRGSVDVGAILAMETGPYGSGPLPYLFLVAAALAVLIGRDWRLGWSVRAWVLALGGFAAVWVQAQGWVESASIAPELLLVPAAVGLAVSSAMGMAAFEVDLPDYHFGLRQIASLLAGLALVVACVPVVGEAFGGRWDMPRGDHSRALAFLDAEGAEAPFRVLWVGDSDLLPLGSWELPVPEGADLGIDGRAAYATSVDGTPEIEELWAGAPSEGTQHLGDVLGVAAEGGTSRLGSLLAPLGVRYVVVPRALAPVPAEQATSNPEGLFDVLDAQLDLSPVTASGVAVYENDVWGPTRAQLPPSAEVPAGDDGDGQLPAVEGAPAALVVDGGVQRFVGDVRRGTVYLGAEGGSSWRLDVDGVEAPRSDALGWASAFTVEGDGPAALAFQTSPTRYLAVAGQVALWLALAVLLLRVRVVSDEGRTLPGVDGRGTRRRS
jgi:GT2 family glycosyltransferase